jgi:SpoVK/Ycf46/Vps4 family AAA+-type ATPase
MSAAVEMLGLDHCREQLQAECLRAAEAVNGMNSMVQELLQPKAALFPVERFYLDGDASPCVLVSVNGQRRELPVAEHVDLDLLAGLEPWQYVKVHPTEMIVVGVEDDQSAFARAQGEMVSFKGYHDRERGLAIVSRFGREDEIVSLAESVRRKNPTTGDRLVLHRDNPRWAIDVIPARQIESKYEIPIEQLTTRLEDLAGVDRVACEIMEDWLLRLVHTDISEKFDLQPLRGILIHSYKAGMGKTALVRALARWLHECGCQHGFDVVLYHIEPCSLKSMWHGEDARLVREEVCGTIRARLERPRDRPLTILVVFDELESLGKRTGGNDTRGYVSSAQNDAVQALLTGMDGLEPLKGGSGPPANVVFIGMTNRPDMVDEALKRPGRMGDLIVEMPDYGPDEAAEILQIYGRSRSLAWYLDGEIRRGMSEHEVYTRILRPAMAQVFPLTVLRYWTEARQAADVTAGEILAGAHYMNVMEQAKRRAAARALWELGAAAVGSEDVADCLLEEAHKVARQLDADRQMLERQLHLRIPVLRTELVPVEQLSQHRYLRSATG